MEFTTKFVLYFQTTLLVEKENRIDKHEKLDVFKTGLSPSLVIFVFLFPTKFLHISLGLS